MSGVRIKIGGPSFRKIRENSNYYVDKTGFIEEFLNAEPPEVSLITRPRRFGKTLMMNTLYDFFDITQDSRSIFEGLAISKNKALCDKWMNQYPVVLFSLKEMEGKTFQDALNPYITFIADLCRNLAYLQESPKVRPSLKNYLSVLENRTYDHGLLESSLFNVCSALHAHWGKPVIVLIDEYDYPLGRAQNNGYYDDMVTFILKLLGPALKDYNILQFAVLSGGLRVSKESLFSGLNNFQCFGISETRYADKFGFTSEEVDGLLSAAGFSEKKEEIQEWYDGYRFGKNTEIFCPWDILQYISFLQDDPDTLPKAYWENASGNNIIRSFIDRTDFEADDDIENLLSGGYVACTINEKITYDTLYKSEENFWTLLYLSGYLTKAAPDKMKNEDVSPNSGKIPLVIPNREIKIIFIQTINSWFDDSMMAIDRKPLFDAFWNGDSKGFQEMFTEIMMSSISYHDYHENYYHAILTGIFIGSGYKARSNPESGLGRPDITVKGKKYTKAAIIEVKHAKSREGMPQAADDALRKIKENIYTAEVSDFQKVMLWGISFYEKFCACKAEEIQQPQPAKRLMMPL